MLIPGPYTQNPRSPCTPFKSKVKMTATTVIIVVIVQGLIKTSSADDTILQHRSVFTNRFFASYTRGMMMELTVSKILKQEKGSFIEYTPASF